MINRFIGILLALLILTLACSDTPTVSPTVDFSLYLQISQAEYDSVYIVLDSVYVISAEDESQKTLISLGPDTVTASEYRNGCNYLITQVQLKPETFSGIEIVYYTGRVVTEEAAHELIPPEGESISAIADGDIEIVRNGDNEALVDLNLLESIEYNSSNGNYEFQPVMRVINSALTGILRGQTYPQAKIHLYDSSTEEHVAFSISDGTDLVFGFYGLEPGQYNLFCSPIGDDTLLYDPLLNYNLYVVENNDYDLGLLTLPEP